MIIHTKYVIQIVLEHIFNPVSTACSAVACGRCNHDGISCLYAWSAPIADFDVTNILFCLLAVVRQYSQRPFMKPQIEVILFRVRTDCCPGVQSICMLGGGARIRVMPDDNTAELREDSRPSVLRSLLRV